MPRVLTRQELESRQARFTDGSPVKKLELAKPPVKETPLVAAPTIDATPIAEAVDRMSSSINETLKIQQAVIAKLSEPSEPIMKQSSWKFTVQRDSKGRMESIIAEVIEQ